LGLPENADKREVNGCPKNAVLDAPVYFGLNDLFQDTDNADDTDFYRVS
jgi:hypothetical protein